MKKKRYCGDSQDPEFSDVAVSQDSKATGCNANEQPGDGQQDYFTPKAGV
jgi:hypothetical protein